MKKGTKVESLCCKGSCPTVILGKDEVIIKDDYDNTMTISAELAYSLAIHILVNDFNEMVRDHSLNGSLVREYRLLKPDLEFTVLPAEKSNSVGDVEISNKTSDNLKMHRDEAFKLAIAIIANDYRIRNDGAYPLSDMNHPVTICENMDHAHVLGVEV